MKKYFAFLMLVLFSATFIACGQKTDNNKAVNNSGEAIPTPGEQNIALQICAVNSDCTPKPDCHPRECINRLYAGDYKKPDVCTQVVYDWAAYREDDCSCANDKCVNDNLN